MLAVLLSLKVEQIVYHFRNHQAEINIKYQTFDTDSIVSLVPTINVIVEFGLFFLSFFVNNDTFFALWSNL